MFLMREEQRYISRFYVQFLLTYIHDNRFMNVMNLKCTNELQLQ